MKNKEGIRLLKKKTMTFDVKQIGAPEDRILRFIGSSEAIDRDNDIIEVAGWQLDNYLKNPVFLWCHDYRQPPIGRAVNVVKDVDNKILSFDIKFATAEEYPFAETIYKLYLGGYMRATSVGFKPMKHKRRDDDAVLDKPEWQRGTRFVEQELLELSAVPVPSNPEALQIARSKGIDTGGVEKTLRELWNGGVKIAWFEETPDFQQLLDRLSQDSKAAEDARLVVHGNLLAVRLTDGNYRTFSFELLQSIDEDMLKDFEQWKAGSTLNAKNKQSLNMIMDCMRDMMGSAGMTPKGCPCETCETSECPCNQSEKGDDHGHDDEREEGKGATPPPTPDIKSIAEAVADILKPLLPQKEAPQAIEINLDAIEVPKATGDNELNIEPETLKQLISDVVNEQLDKARGKIS